MLHSSSRPPDYATAVEVTQALTTALYSDQKEEYTGHTGTQEEDTARSQPFAKKGAAGPRQDAALHAHTRSHAHTYHAVDTLARAAARSLDAHSRAREPCLAA